MSDKLSMTVTLYWRSDGALHQLPMTCDDQQPQALIRHLVDDLALPSFGPCDDPIVYELHLDGEHRPALKPKNLLSDQGVHDGSRLYLLPRRSGFEESLPRCLLHLPDGTEIVVPRRGQELRRAWLLESVHLYHPEAYRREIERMAQRHSVYNYVANRNAHCVVQSPGKDHWIITTDRTDVWTEYAKDHEFERVPIGAPIRLDHGMRLRLGGKRGLEIAIMLI
jgi:hypothetical protein